MPIGKFQVGADFGWLSDAELGDALELHGERLAHKLRAVDNANRPFLRWPVGMVSAPASGDAYMQLDGGPLAGYYWSLLSAFVTPLDPATSIASIRTILYTLPNGWTPNQGVPPPYSAKDFTDAMPDVLTYSEDQITIDPGRRFVFRLTGGGIASTKFYVTAFVIEKPARLAGIESEAQIGLPGGLKGIRSSED